LHSKPDMRSPEHMTAAARFPPLDFHLKGHAGQRIFIHIYNEETFFVIFNDAFLPENISKSASFRSKGWRPGK
jgi:hypothetical protein